MAKGWGGGRMGGVSRHKVTSPSAKNLYKRRKHCKGFLNNAIVLKLGLYYVKGY